MKSHLKCSQCGVKKTVIIVYLVLIEKYSHINFVLISLIINHFSFFLAPSFLEIQIKAFRNDNKNRIDSIFALYQWFLEPTQKIREEEIHSKLSDAMKNNVSLFKNMFGTISINKLAENIKKGGEMISDESVIHLAFAIWQQRTFILIGM
jgi:hypothetical protein